MNYNVDKFWKKGNLAKPTLLFALESIMDHIIRNLPFKDGAALPYFVILIP